MIGNSVGQASDVDDCDSGSLCVHKNDFGSFSKGEISTSKQDVQRANATIQDFFSGGNGVVVSPGLVSCSPKKTEQKPISVMRSAGKVCKLVQSLSGSEWNECGELLASSAGGREEATNGWVIITSGELDGCNNKEEEDFGDGTVDAVVSDDAIASALGCKVHVSELLEEYQLFNKQCPCFRDIRQNDIRRICYILAGAAACLSSERGKKALKAIFIYCGESRVVVELRDPNMTKKLKVSVDLSKLYSEGKNLFSFASTGVAWPAVLEKAFYGINLAIQQRFSEIYPTADEIDPAVRQQLNHALDLHNKAKIDLGALVMFFNRIFIMPSDEDSQIRNPVSIRLDRVTCMKEKSRGSFQDLKGVIQDNLKLGVPIIAATRRLDAARNLLEKLTIGVNAIKKGTPTGMP